ncbi:hypothetical protein PWP93_21835 [Paraburkholderia sp. A1RI-2L]|uniref:hypothetical protein n=1 Tax=Paraburkholderia sp. A1RI-2L TaxID=3028367 RepID=UPI003B779547
MAMKIASPNTSNAIFAPLNAALAQWPALLRNVMARPIGKSNNLPMNMRLNGLWSNRNGRIRSAID